MESCYLINAGEEVGVRDDSFSGVAYWLPRASSLNRDRCQESQARVQHDRTSRHSGGIGVGQNCQPRVGLWSVAASRITIGSDRFGRVWCRSTRWQIMPGTLPKTICNAGDSGQSFHHAAPQTRSDSFQDRIIQRFNHDPS
jgi:hypothetical protein